MNHRTKLTLVLALQQIEFQQRLLNIYNQEAPGYVSGSANYVLDEIESLMADDPVDEQPSGDETLEALMARRKNRT